MKKLLFPILISVLYSATFEANAEDRRVYVYKENMCVDASFSTTSSVDDYGVDKKLTTDCVVDANDFGWTTINYKYYGDRYAIQFKMSEIKITAQGDLSFARKLVDGSFTFGYVSAKFQCKEGIRCIYFYEKYEIKNGNARPKRRVAEFWKRQIIGKTKWDYFEKAVVGYKFYIHEKSKTYQKVVIDKSGPEEVEIDISGTAD